MSLVDSTVAVCTLQRRLVLHSEVHYHLHHPTLALSPQDRAKNSIAKLFDRVRKVLNPFFLSRLTDFGGVETRKEKKKRATGQISY